MTGNSGELARGIRNLLEGVVYEGLDAGPAFAEMIEQYIIGTLLDSVAQTIYAAVVQPLLESAAASATQMATGGTIAGTAVQTGGMLPAAELADIADPAVTMVDVMGHALKDSDFQAAWRQIGDAMNTIGGAISGPARVTSAYDYAAERRQRAEQDRAEREAKAVRDAAERAEQEAKDAREAAERRQRAEQDRIEQEAKDVRDAVNAIRRLEIEIMRAQGQSLEALAAERAMEMEEIKATKPHIADLTKELWALQDKQAILSAFPSENTALEAISEAQALFTELGLELPRSSEAMSEYVRSLALSDDELQTLAATLDNTTAAIQAMDAATENLLSTADSFASSTDFAGMKSNAETAFSALDLSMPDTVTGFVELLRTSAETLDPAALVAFSDSLGDITPYFTEMRSRLDGLANAFPAPIDHAATTTDLFNELGLALPKTSAELSALINSGELTEAQMLSLAGSLDSVTNAFGAIDNLLGAFPASVDAVAKAEAVFSSLGLALPQSSEAMAKFLHGSTVTAEQLMVLSGHTDTLTAAMSELDAATQERIQNEDAVKQERLNLDKEYLTLIGDTNGVRQMEIQNVDESNRSLQWRNWLLQDQQAIEQERLNLDREYLNLIGDTNGVRQMEIQNVDESNQSLQWRNWLLQDQQAIEQERIGLQQQLWQLEGDTA